MRFAQLAVNADGATVAAWERASKGSFAIEARTGGTPGALASAQRLSPHGFGSLVAVGADGTKAVMGMEYGAHRTRAVRVAIARPGHRFGGARDVQRRTASLAPVGVAVQPTGRVVAIYRRGATAASVALARKGHGFGRPQSLGAIGQVISDPRDGSVVVLARSTAAATGTQPGAVSTLSPAASRFSASLPGPFAGSGIAKVPGGLGGKLAGRNFASVAPPSGAFGAPQALTPGGSHRFGFPAIVAAGDETFVASAEPHGSVLVSTRSAGAGTLATPTALATSSDGDVVLAAGGRDVLAAYQQHDRLRLKIVR